MVVQFYRVKLFISMVLKLLKLIVNKTHNNCLHADSHKRHGFCYSQKAAPLMEAGEAGVMCKNVSIQTPSVIYDNFGLA